MMLLAKGKQSLPDELFARKGSQCADSIFCKTIFANVAKVMHRPALLTGADFNNCYNRSAHATQALVLSANGIPQQASNLMLKAL